MVRMLAERGVPAYRLLVDPNGIKASERLRRQTLFMGLSDGARIDTIRHANAGVLRNEQFVQSTQVDIEKWRDLLENLREASQDPEARFRIVYLVDDFAGTGTSFLRFENEKKEWKGKLLRFMRSVAAANGEFADDNLFEEGWILCVHHYVASSYAAGAIQERIERPAMELSRKIGPVQHTQPSA